ncbi:elongation factor EF-1 alpha (eEF1A) methyltransferase Efm4 [Schizosaccharomyces osmophilus]|uniref:Protein-lysine N-methyltransferase EFM4 n=1 Tax=Schizosaccharomyces osmophilus TaxID=2545709 RepID=A0AAE9W756_9SCHI|nr:elongation factor EF-1 alpha (eEF1A) methyltransferase Efm4 [Schizosaccharomyces osmophilus]WBW71182.1 elongation factor EF-1 alpha (eEF1A) methyltransferase Efm4 [Schizosaccharomyces osmophilus]
MSGLPESKLGTKAHWDSMYELEVSNFKEFKDEGEIWFGEESEERIVQWMEDYVSNDQRTSANHAYRVLDLGTGNGHLILRIAEEADTLLPQPYELLGVDYSEKAVELAKQLAEAHDFQKQVKFEQYDIIKDLRLCDRTWDLILDKGTFDAISLSSDKLDGVPLNQVYVDRIHEMLSPTGVFLITSCNWTLEELSERFLNKGFRIHSTVPVPVFEFQGSKGSSTTVVAFELAN